MSPKCSLAFLVLIASAAAGCAKAPTAKPAPAPAHTLDLEEELANDGLSAHVTVTNGVVDPVATIRATSDAPWPSPVEPYLLTLLDRYGEKLGWGKLGGATVTKQRVGVSSGAVTGVFGSYPAATGCPGLRFAADFRALDDGRSAPLRIAFSCPVAASPAQTPKRVELRDDRLSKMMRSEGMEVWRLLRKPFVVSASLRADKPLEGDPIANIRGFADRLAHVEGLPPLDTMGFGLHIDDAMSSAGKKQDLWPVGFGLARPPLDGTCIDPRVSVFAEAEGPDRVWIRAVMVRCAKEPTEGNQAPESPPGQLPAAASGSLPFVAMCERYNFTEKSGTLVDKRGNVFEYSDAAPGQNPTAYDLEVMARNAKHYVGTLAASDVDRLVALVPKVQGERMVIRSTDTMPDRPGSMCSVLRAGADAKAPLVVIPLDKSGADGEKERVGAASSEARAIIGRAFKSK